MKLQSLFLCALCLPLWSCDLILGVNNAGTPLNTYNVMFEIFRNNYAFQSEMPESLDAIYNRYIADVQNLGDDEAAWQAMAQYAQYVIDDIRDYHVYMQGNPSWNRYRAGLQRKWPVEDLPPPSKGDPRYPEYQQLLREEQDPIIAGTITVLGRPFGFVYGHVTSDPEIGYIQIRELYNPEGFGGAKRIEGNAWIGEIDNILRNLKSRGVTKMILDIRTGAGGSLYTPAVIGARFWREERTYMYSYELVGPAGNPDNYKRRAHRIGHIGEGFSGKVIVLVNRKTSSGGEVFLLVARQIPGVTVMGTRTGGYPGIITAYDLPKGGWEMIIATSKTTGTDGKSYLRVGLQPDIVVPDEPDDNSDQILKRAIVDVRGYGK
ncbi:MAG: S41 family peptidase [Spirochaetota bacterium]